MNVRADVLVLGAGAAGATCALYLGRAGLSTVVLDHGRTTLKRAELHNLPGHQPLGGVEWLEEVQQQALSTSLVEFVEAKVETIAAESEVVTIKGSFGEMTSKYLVIASGQGTTPFLASLDLASVEPVQPYVKTNLVVDRWGETSSPRVFAVGVVAGHPSQAVICAGSGANTAIRIATLEKGEFWVDHDSPPST